MPEEFEGLIVNCLAKEPDDRPGSMSEVELVLRGLRESLLFDDASSAALRSLPSASMRGRSGDSITASASMIPRG